jgi:hypothetical protein
MSATSRRGSSTDWGDACPRFSRVLEHVVARGCSLLERDDVEEPHNHHLAVWFRGTLADLPALDDDCAGQLRRDDDNRRLF